MCPASASATWGYRGEDQAHLDADLPALSELAKRTWRDAFGESVSAEESADELEETRSERYFRSALRTDTILVAEAEGELLGYVQFGDVRIPEVDPKPDDRGCTASTSRPDGKAAASAGSSSRRPCRIHDCARLRASTSRSGTAIGERSHFTRASDSGRSVRRGSRSGRTRSERI